jgi:hypothetical protein
MMDHAAGSGEQAVQRRRRPTRAMYVAAAGLEELMAICGLLWQRRVVHGSPLLKEGFEIWTVESLVLMVVMGLYGDRVLRAMSAAAVAVAQAIANALRYPRALGRGMLIKALTALAVVLAGSRHAHLRDAWGADLCGDPEGGDPPSASRRLRLAAGFVIAALRCRLDDAADLVWRPVDALLSSWHGSNLAVLMPVTVAVGLVLRHERFYGLITNAENLGAIAVAPWAAIKALRKYRQIEKPKRPEKKATSADGRER